MTEALAKQLTQIVAHSLKQFESISAEDWNNKPTPEKWSKKEILGHLADSAMNNIHRFIRIKQGDQTNIWYDQNFWVKTSDYEHQNLQAVKTLWKSLNVQIARVWKKINDVDLQKTIPVKDETPTLQFLMEDYIDHLNHHLKQIL
ncbi:MAG: DinB family protein [Reichenbachiella sp.]|uniref:DinB family protein n=1 Tax=Reichenbachiella sp. TaxID=2184521 RepID=UPI0032992ED1